MKPKTPPPAPPPTPPSGVPAGVSYPQPPAKPNPDGTITKDVDGK